MNRLIVIMGVAGAGKSTIATALSGQTRWPMIEGDAHHPPANVAKQAAGVPLDNADRAAWIDSIGAEAKAKCEADVLLACSALNPFVRGRLETTSGRECIWVWLDVSREVLKARLDSRASHFMPASLLDDQLSALEPPPDAVRIDSAQRVDQICSDILTALNQL